MQQTEDKHMSTRTTSLEPDVNPDVINLFDYLEVIAKRWRMIVMVTLVAAVVSVAYGLMLPNIYTAKAKILPPQQQSGLLSAAMMQGALAAIGGDSMIGESKNAKLYSEMLKIESIQNAIIERFKLHEVYKKKYRDDIYKMLGKNVTITAGKEGIITIAVDDKDPNRSSDMANAFVDELKKMTSSMNMTGAGNSRSFLEERINTNKKELVDAENALKSFQSRYKTIDATQQATLSASATAQLAAQLTGQEIQLSVLRRTYADTSQTVMALQQSIAALKEKISRMQSSGGSVALPGFEQIPERGQEYLHLMRKFRTAEAVHELLTKQYEIARLNSENDVSTIQVIQKAVVPDRRSKPKRAMIVVALTIVACIGAIVTAFIQEYFKRMSADDREHWRRIKALMSIRTGITK